MQQVLRKQLFTLGLPMHPTKLTAPVQQVQEPLSLLKLGELLVRYYELHEGLYDVSIEFAMGFGAVGQTPETTVPGVMVGVNKIGLVKVEKKGNSTLDASIVNPKKTSRKK